MEVKPITEDDFSRIQNFDFPRHVDERQLESLFWYVGKSLESSVRLTVTHQRELNSEPFGIRDFGSSFIAEVTPYIGSNYGQKLVQTAVLKSLGNLSPGAIEVYPAFFGGMSFDSFWPGIHETPRARDNLNYYKAIIEKTAEWFDQS